MLLAEKCVAVSRCYVTRTSLKCVAPGLSYGPGSFPGANGGDDRRWDQGDDTRVCFQYSAIDAAPVGSPQYKTNDQLYSQLEEYLKAYGAQSVEVKSPLLLAQFQLLSIKVCHFCVCANFTCLYVVHSPGLAPSICVHMWLACSGSHGPV